MDTNCHPMNTNFSIHSSLHAVCFRLQCGEEFKAATISKFNVDIGVFFVSWITEIRRNAVWMWPLDIKCFALFIKTNYFRLFNKSKTPIHCTKWSVEQFNYKTWQFLCWANSNTTEWMNICNQNLQLKFISKWNQFCECNWNSMVLFLLQFFKEIHYLIWLRIECWFHQRTFLLEEN